MRIRTALLLALCVGLAGVGLRSMIPVSPVDDAFRRVIGFYRSLDKPQAISRDNRHSRE